MYFVHVSPRFLYAQAPGLAFGGHAVLISFLTLPALTFLLLVSPLVCTQLGCPIPTRQSPEPVATSQFPSSERSFFFENVLVCVCVCVFCRVCFCSCMSFDSSSVLQNAIGSGTGYGPLASLHSLLVYMCTVNPLYREAVIYATAICWTQWVQYVPSSLAFCP